VKELRRRSRPLPYQRWSQPEWHSEPAWKCEGSAKPADNGGTEAECSQWKCSSGAVVLGRERARTARSPKTVPSRGRGPRRQGAAREEEAGAPARRTSRTSPQRVVDRVTCPHGVAVMVKTSWYRPGGRRSRGPWRATPTHVVRAHSKQSQANLHHATSTWSGRALTGAGSRRVGGLVWWGIADPQTGRTCRRERGEARIHGGGGTSVPLSAVRPRLQLPDSAIDSTSRPMTLRDLHREIGRAIRSVDGNSRSWASRLGPRARGRDAGRRRPRWSRRSPEGAVIAGADVAISARRLHRPLLSPPAASPHGRDVSRPVTTGRVQRREAVEGPAPSPWAGHRAGRGSMRWSRAAARAGGRPGPHRVEGLLRTFVRPRALVR